MAKKYTPRKHYMNFNALLKKFSRCEITLTRVECVVDHVQYAVSYDIVGFDVDNKKVIVKAYLGQEQTWTMTEVNNCLFNYRSRFDIDY